MHESNLTLETTPTLSSRVQFLSHHKTYSHNENVEVFETDMSFIFITDHFVYKLKKPIHYEFLDFRTVDARFKYCQEEVKLNQILAPDVYLGPVPIKFINGVCNLSGKGVVVDWVIKMLRLPNEHLLSVAIKEDTVNNQYVQLAAAMLVDFYLTETHIDLSSHAFKQQIIKDIELSSTALLKNKFHLQHSLIVTISTSLLHFVIKHENLLGQRLIDKRIVDGHGDLRPEHIFLGAKPKVIGRIEFSRELRTLDVAEELSCLALECEMLGSPLTGQLFLNIYKWKSHDKVPDLLICFYKAKQALHRAKLSIYHVLGNDDIAQDKKWKDQCDAYLQASNAYCSLLQTIEIIEAP